MKKYLLVALLLACINLNATTYYISPSGSNANSGTYSSPWKTLSYACSRADITGDIIHVNAGTYTETQTCVVSVGVSIEGEGASSLIISTVTLSPTIDLSSDVETLGSQEIHGIKISGSNLIGCNAILVNKRRNVNIHDCVFVDFKNGASHFASALYEYVIEIRNSEDIEIHHNTIEGGIRAFEFRNLWIRNNVIGKNLMNASPETGVYISGIDGVKINNNYFKNLAMQIELIAWGTSVMKNVYIYNNIMTNIGVTSGDNYGSGVVFHGLTSEMSRNLNVVNNTMEANPGNRSTMIGVWLPTIGNAKHIVIRNNIIKGFKYASIFAAGPEQRMDSLYIENNILYENAIEGVKVDSATNLPYFTNVALPTYTVQNNLIIADPQFVSSSDFHLKNQSPGVGEGISTPWITNDYEDYRVLDPPNIGAFGGTPIPTVIFPNKIYNDDVVVYPNPTIDHVNIAFKDYNFYPDRIQIIDMRGRILIDENLSLNTGQNGIVDVYFNLSSGIYIIEIWKDRKIAFTTKMIVAK